MMYQQYASLRSAVVLTVYALALCAAQWVGAPTANALNLTPNTAGPVTPSPTSLQFNAQVAATRSAPLPITLTNNGTTTVTLAAITVTGSQGDDFAQSNNCGSTLGAGAACNISIFFVPISAGAKSAALAVTESASASPHLVALSGTGTPAHGLSLSATALAFGSLTAGNRSNAQSITLTNAGSAAVTFTSIAVTGGQADDFAQSTSCGAVLAIGASCKVSLFFTPVSAGTKSATLTLTDSASGSPQQVTLSGTGTAATGLSLSTTSLAFGSVTVGNSSSSRSVTLTNGGSAAIAIYSIAVTGSQADDFAQSSTCGASLAPGAACDVALFFTPVSAGAKSAVLSITDSATGSSQRISLSGNGAPAPGLGVSANSLTFGSLPVGNTSTGLFLVLTNTGTAAVTLASIGVTGSQAKDFTQSNNCGASLKLGMTCKVTLFFAPVSAGAKSAALTITDSAIGSPHRVTLFGTGLIPAPSALSYASPQTFTVGTAITQLSPIVTGTVANYSSQPALPAGLVLDPLSGQISGTPTASAHATNYVIMASNSTGSTTFSITVTVRIAAPSALSYHARQTYYVGTPIKPLWPAVTGTVTSYSVTPALPAGFSLNSLSGAISGTPTAAHASANYTITATNSTGSTNTVITFAVVLLAPQSLSYPSPQSVAVGLPVASLSPFVVGVVANYSVAPALPNGLSLDLKTGVITGTPTSLTPTANYNLTATNPSGSSTFVLALAVTTVGVTPAHVARLIAAGTPLIVQLAVASQSLSGPLYVVASDPAKLFNPAAIVTATASGFAVALRVSPTTAAGHYTGSALLTLCRDAACATTQTAGSVSVPYDVQVLSATSAWSGNHTSPLAAWNGVADWTMFQGNAAHTGYVPVAIDPNSFSTRWQGGPTLANSPGYSVFAYTLTTDADQLYIATGTKLYALKEFDASTVWTYDVAGLAEPSVNPPAEANDTVYMAAGQQESTYLFAFDEATGNLVFKSPMTSQWEHYLAPTIGADGIYTNAGTYGGLYGFDFAGNRLFFDGLAQQSEWTPAVDDDHVYSYTGQLTVADPITGKVAATINDPTFTNYVYSIDGSAVLGASGSVFAAPYENSYLNGGGIGNDLTAFNVPAKGISWQIAGDYANTPAYNAGIVYAANNSPLRLEARAESDGSLLWSWTPPQAGDARFNSEVLLTKSVIFVSTNLATYGIDAVTHQLVFSYPFSGRLALSHNGILYIQGSGPIIAINVK